MARSDLIIDATLRLLATRPYDRVTIHDIADEAGIGLSDLAAEFPTRGAILDAFVRRIDAEVLANSFEDMADEPPRERLFDVLMTRLDALRPYRAALKSLIRSARRDPALGVALNGYAVRSQVWMLAAAGIDASGLRGRVAAQALSLAFLRVLRIFVDEDDPGMPRTMAALDQELRRTESRHNRLARWVGPAIRNRRAPEPATAPDASAYAGTPNDADHEPYAAPMERAADPPTGATAPEAAVSDAPASDMVVEIPPSTDQPESAGSDAPDPAQTSMFPQDAANAPAVDTAAIPPGSVSDQASETASPQPTGPAAEEDTKPGA